MNTLTAVLAAVLAAGTLSTAVAAPAVPIDGTLDAAYGPALSTQAVQTPGDNSPLDIAHATGSELDQGYAFVVDGVLHLFLAGNVRGYFNVEFYPQDNVQIFVDSRAGGQNVLRGDNSGVGFYANTLNLLAGLTFDAGFEPDYWFDCTVGPQDPPVFAYAAELLGGGGGGGLFLGRTTAGGPGMLSGGTNPDGILATIDNLNTAGVALGCDGASGAGVSTGIEWAIPLSAIGNPTGCFRVCAFINIADPVDAQLLNQVLGPVPPGTCLLGVPSGVSLAGDQFFTVCPGSTPARPTTWGAMKTLYR